MANSLIINFGVNDSNKTLDFDTSINIRVKPFHLLAGSEVPSSGIPIGYYALSSTVSHDVIALDDTLSKIPENLSDDGIQTIILKTPKFKSQYNNLLITDVFLNEDTTEETPLFYLMDLGLTEDSDGNEIDITSVKILDKNFIEVSEDLYTVRSEALYEEYNGVSSSYEDITKTYIYTNLSNSYDQTTKNLRVYYVTYTRGGVGYVKVLSTQNIYKQSTLETLHNFRRYTIKDGSFYQIEIKRSPALASHKYAVKINKHAFIKLSTPYNISNSYTWNTSISNGSFWRVYNNKKFRYRVGEYSNQVFNPVEPYKKEVNGISEVCYQETLSTKTLPIIIQLPQKNVVLDENKNMYLDVVVYNRNGQYRFAFTNNPSKVYVTDTDGNITTNVFIQSEGKIISVDKDSGLLCIKYPVSINLEDKVYCTFYYEKNDYVLDNLDLNPCFNGSVLDNVFSIFCVPESQGSYMEKNIFWLQLDKFGYITDYDNNISTYLPELADYLDSSDFTYVHFLYDYIATSNKMTEVIDEIDMTASGNPGWFEYELYIPIQDELISSVNFSNTLLFKTRRELDYGVLPSDPNIGDWVISSDGSKIYLYATTFDKSTAGILSYSFVPDNYNQFLLLGEVTITEKQSPRNLQFTDLRVNGGGIKKDKFDLAVKKDYTSYWTWDNMYWDGKPFPGAGVVYIEFEESLKDDFSETEIKNGIQKHIAEGFYPLIKYYSANSSLLSVYPFESQYIGLGTYVLYYRLQNETSWSTGAITEVTEIPVGNAVSYELSSELVDNTLYLVKIEYESNPSNIIYEVKYVST